MKKIIAIISSLTILASPAFAELVTVGETNFVIIGLDNDEIVNFQVAEWEGEGSQLFPVVSCGWAEVSKKGQGVYTLDGCRRYSDNMITVYDAADNAVEFTVNVIRPLPQEETVTGYFSFGESTLWVKFWSNRKTLEMLDFGPADPDQESNASLDLLGDFSLEIKVRNKIRHLEYQGDMIWKVTK